MLNIKSLDRWFQIKIYDEFRSINENCEISEGALLCFTRITVDIPLSILEVANVAAVKLWGYFVKL